MPGEILEMSAKFMTGAGACARAHATKARGQPLANSADRSARARAHTARRPDRPGMCTSGVEAARTQPRAGGQAAHDP
jgi:hypothetical protein